MKFNKKYAIAIIIILILIFTIIFIIKNSNNKYNDSEKFSNEYKNVPINNKYRYIDIKDALKIIEDETGVIFIGYSDCVYCQEYAKHLNEVAIDSSVEKVYYLDIYKDRKKHTDDYEKLIKKLNKFLSYDEEGNKIIKVPASIYILNGSVIEYDDETSVVTSTMGDVKNYWSNDKILKFKDKISQYINDTLTGGVCNSEEEC